MLSGLSFGVNGAADGGGGVSRCSREGATIAVLREMHICPQSSPGASFCMEPSKHQCQFESERLLLDKRILFCNQHCVTASSRVVYAIGSLIGSLSCPSTAASLLFRWFILSLASVSCLLY